MLRLNKGLSQLQLAQRLNTHQPAIARWERNPEQMTYSTICQIASALGVTEQEIFDATRQKPASAQLAREVVNNEG